MLQKKKKHGKYAFYNQHFLQLLNRECLSTIPGFLLQNTQPSMLQMLLFFTFNTESIPSLRVLHVHNVRDWQPPWTSIHLRRGGKVLDSAEGIRQGQKIDLIV